MRYRDPDAHGEDPGGGSCGGAETRRGRLSRKAVRSFGTAGARRIAITPRAEKETDSDRAVRVRQRERGFRPRPGPQAGGTRDHGGEGIAVAAVSDRPPGHRRLARRTIAKRLGISGGGFFANHRCARRVAPAEIGRQSAEPAVHSHSARRRISFYRLGAVPGENQEIPSYTETHMRPTRSLWG